MDCKKDSLRQTDNDRRSVWDTSVTWPCAWDLDIDIALLLIIWGIKTRNLHLGDLFDKVMSIERGLAQLCRKFG